MLRGRAKGHAETKMLRAKKLHVVFVLIGVVIVICTMGVLFKKPTEFSTNFAERSESLTHFQGRRQRGYESELQPVGEQPQAAFRQCKALFEGDRSAAVQAKKFMENHPKVPVNPEQYKSLTRNCSDFIHRRGYITSVSQVETNFPIAFSLVVYKDVEQVERLLRAIYRPQNYYCVHVDKKSPRDFMKAITAIAGCFKNVIIPSVRIHVVWGRISVLEPEFLCMRELLKYQKWKYFINLTGQEFPLKTNKELVKILQIFNGANDIAGSLKKQLSTIKKRTGYVYIGNKNTFITKSPPPAGIHIHKGQMKITATREFVDYVIHNETAHLFLDWVNGTLVPDETYFVSLNNNPQLGVPGAHIGDPDKKPYLTRYVVWVYGKAKCWGKEVRHVCVFGVSDLPSLIDRKELFVNKFHLTFEYLTYDCMEEMYFNKTRVENALPFNSDYYRNLEFVRNHV
ncbi:beta-1,3-galactosyl-O-glycosyl-glycoprotein beta-1,6-N-acetylglucosaminyltransferase-like isoform X1 [Lingula anatina]|uniref:Beta-1,3-galactosyl-O-glycosyl-glycoprotein beta-1,6-N-acetylglucosaminyltransferase-like isoform X1 n=2 Tax=Lingula anatina TaxID=7574 RepID=A0A1S3HJ32_LINAN|nr:beta-1,3-galactosyl-O-glycosyl-glycoprotein beta-1,6-N-acetylglucosaminyltransferase-like isoform X1 [Lingula anatina]|eukprot:XP_013386123.1 beta-1,3-galactosyl-O-glycosyl-glycoprotein beta-1,6-N-acetylglucosaminyltransferase-like isoform X1 [Lingula anatina]